LTAYEFKWKKRSKDKIPNSFLESYSASGKIIDSDNFREFIMPGEGA
jgi:hypothetical protein